MHFSFRWLASQGNGESSKQLLCQRRLQLRKHIPVQKRPFFPIWAQYEVSLGSLGFISSVEVIFFWVVEQVPAGHQPSQIRGPDFHYVTTQSIDRESYNRMGYVLPQVIFRIHNPN